jgi:hypothetical protein
MNTQTKILKDVLDIKALHKFANALNFDLDTLNSTGTSNNVNIINVRNTDRNSGTFNDSQVIYYIDRMANKAGIAVFDVTVDPSKHYLLKPMNNKGTAIVMPGQYYGAWKQGYHKGKYKALVQSAPINVIRDNDLDDILDIPDGHEYSRMLLHEDTVNTYSHPTLFTVADDKGNAYVAERGMFGINCHRASSWKILDKIGLYGAGCVVYHNPNDYVQFMNIIEKYSMNNNKSYSPIWIDYNTLIANI